MPVRVDFMYRDACNYKTINSVTFEGDATPELVDRFLATRDNGEWIVPEQVGLEHPALADPVFNNGRFPDEEDDHGWVEVERDDIHQVTTPATDRRTFEEFVRRCERAAEQGWDSSISIEAAGGWSDKALAARLRGGEEE